VLSLGVASGVCGSSGVGTPEYKSRRLVTRVSTNSGNSLPREGQRARERRMDESRVGSSSSRNERRREAKEAEHEGAKKPPTSPGRQGVELVKRQYSVRKPPVGMEKRRADGALF